MPKPLVRMHSYMLEQSASATFTYNKMAAEFNIHTKECDYPVMTNLPVFPLHSLRVSKVINMHTLQWYTSIMDTNGTYSGGGTRGAQGSCAPPKFQNILKCLPKIGNQL